MKLAKPRKRKQAKTRRVLGKYVVADPEICHGQLTFIGTRILVDVVLEQAALGLERAEIIERWGGRVTNEAISEALELSRKALSARQRR